MLFKTFGKKESPAILLLHDTGLSASFWKPVIRQLKKQEFYIIAPTYSGHGPAVSEELPAIGACAKEIAAWLDTQHLALTAICGAGFGADIALSLLSRSPDRCQYAVLESPVIGGVGEKPAPALLWKNEKFRRKSLERKFASLRLKEGTLEDFMEEVNPIRSATYHAAAKAESAYELPPDADDIEIPMLVLFGAKEPDLRIRSSLLVCQHCANAFAEPLPKQEGSYLSLYDPEDYVFRLERLMKDGVKFKKPTVVRRKVF